MIRSTHQFRNTTTSTWKGVIGLFKSEDQKRADQNKEKSCGACGGTGTFGVGGQGNVGSSKCSKCGGSGKG